MEIRKLSLNNIEEIKTLIVKIFSQEPWNDNWEPAQLHHYALELINCYNALPLGLYYNGKLCGISLGRIKHWCGGTEYWIDEFGIVPELQNNGCGTAFLNQIKVLLAKEQINNIVLLTERSMQAYRFYLKNGFTELPEQTFLAANV